jgi:hypothetical protein
MKAIEKTNKANNKTTAHHTTSLPISWLIASSTNETHLLLRQDIGEGIFKLYH